MTRNKRILLTGATGYVGGHLLDVLLEEGYDVRCLARKPEFVSGAQERQLSIFKADVLDPSSLEGAFDGVDTAFYLIHSMGSAGSFEESDRIGATNFANAARSAGVKRIVYLGGLGNEEEELSPHLRSRHEVGRILRKSGVETIEFRASIVIGAGSLSFEMVRSLVDRLPVMITPSWVSKSAQPIAIDDLLQYLLEAIDLPRDGHQLFEIGGADQVSYAEIMRAYAARKGRSPRMIRIPFLTPYLSSLWLGLVTPLYARIGRKLIESIIHSTIVEDRSGLNKFSVIPLGIEAALDRALSEEPEMVRRKWSDPVSSSGLDSSSTKTEFSRRFTDSRRVFVPVPPNSAFTPIQIIGGTTGWYAWNWLWYVRGFLDLLIGGIGIRRGRRHARDLEVGDTVDWWRVVSYVPEKHLRLEAEMKLPGRAWLEFEVSGNSSGSVIRQTATFDSVGIVGKLYWYMSMPLHQLIFRGMLRRIREIAASGREN